MTLLEAETLAIQVLKQVMEEALTATNIEVAAANVSTGKFTIYNKEQLEAIIARA